MSPQAVRVQCLRLAAECRQAGDDDKRIVDRAKSFARFVTAARDNPDGPRAAAKRKAPKGAAAG